MKLTRTKDPKKAKFILLAQYFLALKRFERAPPENYRKTGAQEKVNIAIRYDHSGVATMGSLRATPPEFYSALHYSYLNLDGEEEKLRAQLAETLPLIFCEPDEPERQQDEDE